MKQKLTLLLAFIVLGFTVCQTSLANAFPQVPGFNEIFKEDGMATDTGTSTLGIARSLFSDMITWVAPLLGLLAAAILLVAVRRGISGGVKRVFGGKRRRGRRR